MAGAFNDGQNEYILSLKNALIGKKATYHCAAHSYNKQGSATGKLLGGNLTLLANVIGTASDYDTKNAILFIEDIGEYLYSIDRLLQQLKRSGKLSKLSGIIIGGFTDMKDTERPFGKTVEEIIKDLLADYDYPVCYHFPVSHAKENVALKVGATYNLQVKNKKSVLTEL